jgi:hypothetical protein
MYCRLECCSVRYLHMYCKWGVLQSEVLPNVMEENTVVVCNAYVCIVGETAILTLNSYNFMCILENLIS